MDAISSSLRVPQHTPTPLTTPPPSFTGIVNLVDQTIPKTSVGIPYWMGRPLERDSSVPYSRYCIRAPLSPHQTCASPSFTGIVNLLDLTIPTDHLILSGNPVRDGGNDGLAMSGGDTPLG